MEEPKAEKWRQISHYLVMCEGAQDIAIHKAEKKKTRRRENRRKGSRKERKVSLATTI
jgi:hypothetical protein